MLEHRKNQFRDSLPMFDALMSKSTAKPKITLSEGFEGVRQVHMQGLEGPFGGERLILGTHQVWLASPEENAAYIAERVKKNIRLRMIFPHDEIHYAMLEGDKAELRQTRFIDKSIYSPTVETLIYPHKVAFMASSEREPFATVIENPAIAEAERQKFEMLWEIAKEKLN